MKLLYFDSLFSEGHKQFNNRYISIMRSMGINVIVLAPPGWFDECYESVSGFRFFTGKECTEKKVSSRVKVLFNCLNLFKSGQMKETDVIYFASYDIIVFFIFFLLISRYKSKIVLQQHNNVDQLCNMVKRLVFSLFSNKVRHFVFEDYIGKELENYGVDSTRIFVIPHPLPHPDNIDAYKGTKCNKVFGPSNSNSESIIDELVSLHERKKTLNGIGATILLKSQSISYDDTILKVSPGWIDKQMYYKLMAESGFLFLPFSPSKYTYRVSNSFFEGVIYRKKIITTRFMLAEYYEKKYPNICRIVDNLEDLRNAILTYERIDNKSLNEFVNDHSDDVIRCSLHGALIQR